MTDSEIVSKLRAKLSKAGEWYNEHKGDDDYLYDMAYEQFNQLSRADCASILYTLFSTNQ